MTIQCLVMTSKKANILNEYFTSISNIADADENVNIYNQPPTHNL